MLEFDDSLVITLNANNGCVVIPASEYNELLRKADAASNAITLNVLGYMPDKRIEATIDKHWLYGVIINKLREQYPSLDTDGYTVLQRPDDLLVLGIPVAHKEPAEPEESTD